MVEEIQQAAHVQRFLWENFLEHPAAAFRDYVQMQTRLCKCQREEDDLEEPDLKKQRTQSNILVQGLELALITQSSAIQRLKLSLKA